MKHGSKPGWLIVAFIRALTWCLPSIYFRYLGNHINVGQAVNDQHHYAALPWRKKVPRLPQHANTLTNITKAFSYYCDVHTMHLDGLFALTLPLPLLNLGWRFICFVFLFFTGQRGSWIWTCVWSKPSGNTSNACAHCPTCYHPHLPSQPQRTR